MTKDAYEDERAQILWDFRRGKYDATVKDGLLKSLEEEYILVDN